MGGKYVCIYIYVCVCYIYMLYMYMLYIYIYMCVLYPCVYTKHCVSPIKYRVSCKFSTNSETQCWASSNLLKRVVIPKIVMFHSCDNVTSDYKWNRIWIIFCCCSQHLKQQALSPKCCWLWAMTIAGVSPERMKPHSTAPATAASQAPGALWTWPSEDQINCQCL